MFFDMDLLCRQRRGKFALIWYASTCGISKLHKKEIEKACIARICDEILKYVMCRSTCPSNRLSLYLAAKLMWGTVLVYQRQVENFKTDMVSFMHIIRRPIFTLDDRPKRPKKAGKPKKRATIDPAMELLNLEQQMMQTVADVNVTDVIHITLRDEVSTRININEQELFGDEGHIDQQLDQLAGIEWPRILDPEPLPVPPAVDAVDKRQIASVEDVEQSPSKRRKSDGAHVFPVVNVREIGSISPASPRRLMPPPASPVAPRAVMPPPASPVAPSAAMPPPASPRVLRSRTELTANEIRENLQQPSPTRPARIRPTRRRLSMDVLTPSRWQPETIHRTDKFFHGRRSESREGSQISLGSRNLDPRDIVAEILCNVSYKEEDMISVIRNINENLSLDHGLPLLRMAPDSLAQTLYPAPGPELTLPNEANLTLAPVLPQVETLPDVPLMPEVPPMPFSRLSRISKDFDPNLEIKQEPAEVTEIEQPIPRVHTSTPVTLETEARRLSVLLKYIQELFLRNGYQPLELKDVCHPLNRLIVARTFNALLHLHSDQYIKLKSSTRSLELKKIYPGRRLSDI